MGENKELLWLALPEKKNQYGHPAGKEAGSTSKDCPLPPACAWQGCGFKPTLSFPSRDDLVTLISLQTSVSPPVLWPARATVGV